MIANPYIWFGQLELTFVPKHFIKCPSTVSIASKYWVINNATGRFAFAEGDERGHSLFNDIYVYFENNADAIMFELLWSS